MDTNGKILLVGEANPYGGDPRFALYPLPERSAGGRLCTKIMRLSKRDYLNRFERTNLCASKWSIKEARTRAEEIRCSLQKAVLFGAKVCKAFGELYTPFQTNSGFLILPHPSGLCRVWNEPDAYARARQVLRDYGTLTAEEAA